MNPQTKLEYVESAIASRSNAWDGVRNVQSGAAYVMPPFYFPSIHIDVEPSNHRIKQHSMPSSLGLRSN